MLRQSVACLRVFVARDIALSGLAQEEDDIFIRCSCSRLVADDICIHRQIISNHSSIRNEIRFILGLPCDYVQSDGISAAGHVLRSHAKSSVVVCQKL